MRFICVVAFLLTLGMPAHAAAPARPNVLLIISDDRGCGDLALYANPHLRTPNLDRLATNGIQIERFFVSPDGVLREEIHEMGWRNPPVGPLTLSKGKSTLSVEALTRPGEQVMQLKSVYPKRED